MKRYVIFVIDQQSGGASGDEMAAIDTFNDRLRAGDHWQVAVGIGGPKTATLIDGRSERAELIAGSLFDSNDFYSGFWVIQAESEDQARELAVAGSRACNRRVELRPLL